MLQKIEYEGDSAKVQTLSKVYCRFGTTEHKNDPNKYAVLETIARLTNNQRVIFMALNEVAYERKSVGDNVVYTLNALWLTSFLTYLKSNPMVNRQLSGNVALDEDLDILTSFNLIANLRIPVGRDVAYRITTIGKRAYSYLKETE